EKQIYREMRERMGTDVKDEGERKKDIVDGKRCLQPTDAVTTATTATTEGVQTHTLDFRKNNLKRGDNYRNRQERRTTTTRTEGVRERKSRGWEKQIYREMRERMGTDVKDEGERKKDIVDGKRCLQPTDAVTTATTEGVQTHTLDFRKTI
ncbi:hypothetical protein, partial [Halocalculus aciditolerans]|uniref:hypothetical protein n=1 Tax=Halocalculus aciditolerans TaxID=1383812 RepID=UPI00166658A2